MSENDLYKRCAEAQRLYCQSNRVPLFAPTDGFCPRCGRSVYEGERGYGGERAGRELITGCPHCAATFID